MWRQRARYWCDSTMSRGTPALIGWLGLASALLVVVVSALVLLLTPSDVGGHGGWAGVLWMSLLRTLDPGTMGGDEGSYLFLALRLLVTVGGVFTVSSFIGVLTTGLEAKIAVLRKGRSRIMERNHTVILGWPQTADADIQVIKVLLSLGSRSTEGHRPHVVAAVADSANLPAARLAAGPEAQLIGADDFAVRLIVQAHRQSGLSAVCSDLLAFAGHEFYLRREPGLVGTTFDDAVTAYELGTPVGLRHADGSIQLNPPAGHVIAADDELIMVAEDDTLTRRAQTRATDHPTAGRLRPARLRAAHRRS